MKILALIWHIGRQMGLHYVLFRAGRWLQAKTGMLKWRFPRVASSRSIVSSEQWLACDAHFLFDPENLAVVKNSQLHDLRRRASRIREGKFPYFGHQWFAIADWHTNPLTGHTYDRNAHWSEVNDFSIREGDIKYVWEKSRFTFLYDLVRYDFHFGTDQSDLVFQLITNWIDQNPVNCGPNWKCSQEIALRVLNWTFALHYYRRSVRLDVLNKILCSIDDQMSHVAGNIRFSRITVRNNHILTEALALFTVGLMYPFFSKSRRWLAQGKALFEKEIIAQIAPDGTYLQFSMNYHRVVVQLLTWGLMLAERNRTCFSHAVYDRAEASLIFLRTCMDDRTGQLPNFGHNDGALFFPLSECSFRDFRPQLFALANVLGVNAGFQKCPKLAEESAWLVGACDAEHFFELVLPAVSTFQQGYYLIRDGATLTFLRCGAHYSRPFQADQQHLDIWIDGRNILRDAGTWLYNADEASTRYFSGTRSHNTVMLDDFDQMQKHHRFIWTHWITKACGNAGYSHDQYCIEAEFEGFRHVGKKIVHRRRVVKTAGQMRWEIEDEVLNVPNGMRIRQLWHPDECFEDEFSIHATNANGDQLACIKEGGWYSDSYGLKAASSTLVFETDGHFIKTIIQRKNI